MGTAGVALAAPANASDDLVIGDCNATVTGDPGAPVSMDLGALLGTGDGPYVPIGSIPQNSMRTLNVAPKLADAKDDGLLGSVTGTLEGILTEGCNVTFKAANDTSKPLRTLSAPVTKAAKPVTKPAADAGNELQKATNTRPQVSKDEHPDEDETPPPENNPGGGDPGGGGDTPPPNQGGNGGGGNGQPPSNQPTPEQRQQQREQSQLNGVPLYGQLSFGNSAPVSPASLYSSIPAQSFSGAGFGVPGNFGGALPQGNYGMQVPGYAPSFGRLGGRAPGQQQPRDPVRTAGKAKALDTAAQPSGTGNVGLPLLLAVFALAGVTAGLVRSWLLRKASPGK